MYHLFILIKLQNDMDEARDTIRLAIEISNQKRKSVKLSEFFWGQNVEDWTEEQIHGKLLPLLCFKIH